MFLVRKLLPFDMLYQVSKAYQKCLVNIFLLQIQHRLNLIVSFDKKVSIRLSFETLRNPQVQCLKLSFIVPGFLAMENIIIKRFLTLRNHGGRLEYFVPSSYWCE